MGLYGRGFATADAARRHGEWRRNNLNRQSCWKEPERRSYRLIGASLLSMCYQEKLSREYVLPGETLAAKIFPPRQQVQNKTVPTYRFELRDGSAFIQDDVGVTLADRSLAIEYACEVARELMRGCEKRTRHWQLDIYDGEGNLAFVIPFAAVDETLDCFEPSFRQSVENFCQVRRTLGESMAAARRTVRESRALVARSRGKPYLAAEGGQTTIKPQTVAMVGRTSSRKPKQSRVALRCVSQINDG